MVLLSYNETKTQRLPYRVQNIYIYNRAHSVPISLIFEKFSKYMIVSLIFCVILTMFTKGRIIFALIFTVVFIAGLVWSYRKDIKERSENFKGSLKTSFVIILFLLGCLGVIQLFKFL